MTEAIISTQSAFKLKGSLFTLTVLQLIEPELELFCSQLADLTQQAPKFFTDAPIILDLQLLNDQNAIIDFKAIHLALRNSGMIPVGVRGGTTLQHTAAKAAGMAVLALTKSENPEPNSQQASEPTDEPRSHAKLITTPVRSGQQIYARDADLIITAPVSHGAEILADGNIHVYGPLRGRALAGISGDTTSRIFCQSMEAELISICGRYIVNDALTSAANKRPMQIYLEEGKLQLRPL